MVLLRTGRILNRGLDSTDRAQRRPYKKDRGPVFSQYGPEQAWLIRDLLHDWKTAFKENLYTENCYPEDFVKTMCGKNFKEHMLLEKFLYIKVETGHY